MIDLAQRLRLNATIPLVMQAADRIEALEAALRRIDAIIDSPASFNQDIEDVCRAALAPEQDK